MPIHRIPVSGDAYVLVEPPSSNAGVPLADALGALAARSGAAGLPGAVTWDLRLHARLGEAVVRLGDAPLDDLLLSQFDAAPACAVLESVLQRLRTRGAIRKPDQTGEALAVLARDPAARITALPGFSSAPVVAAEGGKGRRLRPAGQPALITVAVLVRGEGSRVGKLLDMLADQRVAGPMDVLVASCGLDRDGTRALSEVVEASRGGAGRPRIRLFNLSGEMSEATLANTAVSLASGEVVVLADPRCAPGGPDTVQSLAAWAAGGDTLSASPRLLDGAATQLAAGLGLVERQIETGGGEALAAWTSPALSDLVRRTAAPMPWFFAVNRAAWLARHGADPRRTGLWTASLAEAQGGGAPESRHLLVGPTTAIWLDSAPPPALAETATLSAASREARRAARLVDAGQAVARALAPSPRVQASSASFTDAFPTDAALRLLVFADGYGASQSISFVEGLSQSRNGRGAAVRIVEEAAFGPDGPAFDAERADALVRGHLEETDPTVVVLSRFGHAGGYDAILRALADTPARLAAHLDDNLFELPVCVGVERYRIARHPWRIHTLHRALQDADLILAATDPLTVRLGELAGTSRVVSLGPGAGGAPRPRRPSKPGGPVTIGYMGSASHNHDLEMVAPALNRLMARFEEVSVELFGSIADQPAADLLEGRVRRLKPVTGDYWAFKRTLEELGWDIGLAPLRPIPYNMFKTPTKWAEYAEAGIVTVASDMEVYRDMIAAEAAVPARPDEWEAAIARLIQSPQVRERTVAAADRLLAERFGWARLERRLLDTFGRLTQPVLAAE